MAKIFKNPTVMMMKIIDQREFPDTISGLNKLVKLLWEKA